jgi:hypothetical protein
MTLFRINIDPDCLMTNRVIDSVFVINDSQHEHRHVP